jgi:hypothetical protein
MRKVQCKLAQDADTGARAALPTLSRGSILLGQWLRGHLARAHSNTVVVALAAEMARMVWALLRALK